MKKILYIPLDERPCNYDYPSYLADISTNIEIIRPEMSVLGYKKKPAEINLVYDFINKHYKEVDGILVSIDMLLYGGIVPSRVHFEEENDLNKRLEILNKIKQEFPEIKIYAYHLIMRCPSYSSDDEEPTYYQNCGKEIHRLGILEHKKQLGIILPEEEKQIFELKNFINKDNLEDYLYRRQKNLNLIFKSLDLVAKNVIDFLIIPQDDAAVYGFTQMEQALVRKKIEDKDLELKVYMYPDADGVCTTLLARFMNFFNHTKPKVFIRYNATLGEKCIPFFEDRPVGETLKYHIIACGGLVASSIEEAEMVVMVNMVPTNMQSARIQFDRNPDYVINRNIVEYVEYIDYLINDLKKPVLIADCAYSGGGDYQLFKLLRQKDLLHKVHSYSGWNTCSNAMSTTFSLGMFAYYYGQNMKFYQFLFLRYLDDIFYQGIVRQESNQLALTKENCSMWVYDGIRGSLARYVKERLKYYLKKDFNNPYFEIKLIDSYQPWNRSYETCLEIKVEKLK